MFWIIAGAILIGATLWGPIVSNVEQAKYTVLETHGSIEIRDYDPMIVAEVEVSGEREAAIQEGFRMIADYIFGNNIAAKKVAMTAPVIQQASEKISMTAPVTQQIDGSHWKVSFVMPGSYTLATLPKPKNDAVKLKEIGNKRFAAIRFSGTGSEENLQKHTRALEQFLEERQLKAISGPTYAFFNPPWTLPLLRRNEVMIEIKSSKT